MNILPKCIFMPIDNYQYFSGINFEENEFEI